MALILSIDTSTKVCSVALFLDGEEVCHQAYHLQKSHSSLLPGIAKDLVANADYQMSDLEAVSVSGGPGSYTGLRIGTSAAKGLCYGLDIPLISIDSLDSMFEVVRDVVQSNDLVCPMIDARRMEVFCNLRSGNGETIWESKPLILEEDTFKEFAVRKIFLIGNGAEKCKALYGEAGTIVYLPKIYPNAFSVGTLVENKFSDGAFEDLAYFEPDYLKEYRTNLPKQKLKS
ncbi:tRNA (adenosine(37)-N6)-threonylcarbamoyltransferase complex dimerization subunit type 1 TsaB [Marinoscillum sp. MHG1-6]|uniref:tRNA (adenosine(37)-N6)-threonylcarbamoyltransferase complex dimerization subunit type 1 TsaB n=1 Tax=Marinoscillum sp. MHG1-6 TaxID=2959627 RepID=UPI0021578894|nr:tRNA (adenosine(37)-N6)-threonylcarbamoyltransferase complex dimerization subunit type 1 TsaB [Marinoscillum sp. MHG1-6]